jgi:polygalacturonase
MFLTGALTLHSDMELYVDNDATLQGTDNADAYLPKIKSRFEGIEYECYRSLLNVGEIDSKGGYTSSNIVIRGGGSILGGGRALMIDTIEKESGVEFRDDEAFRKEQRTAWTRRGRLLQACNVENIIVENVTIGEGASWNLHFIYSKNIFVFGCKVVSTEVNNGDGIDPDSCEDCTIFNCIFDTRDDMVAIKSGKNPEGNIINRPSKNIKIFDCSCEHGHGLALGSEMSGGVENVRIWNCQMEKSRCGMEIKGVKERGGYVKDVRVYDSAFSILAIRSVDYNTDGVSAQTPPIFEDYYFENVSLTGVCLKHTGETWDESAIILEGFDEENYCLKNVTLKDVTIERRANTPKQNLALFCVNGLTIENLCCK